MRDVILFVFSTTLLVVLLGPSISFAGQSALHCVATVQKGDRTHFQNNCAEQISIAYCSTNRKISGSLCGQGGSDWNPYYTHMMQLKGGELEYFGKEGDLEYAACFGFISSFTAKGWFTSDQQGNFGCHN